MNFLFRGSWIRRLLVGTGLFLVAIGNDLAGTSIVNIKAHAYTPATVVAAVGDTVTWVNQDDDPHTVKSSEPDGVLKSPALDTNDRYSFTFAKPGVYKYFCTLHPQMQGEILVH